MNNNFEEVLIKFFRFLGTEMTKIITAWYYEFPKDNFARVLWLPSLDISKENLDLARVISLTSLANQVYDSPNDNCFERAAKRQRHEKNSKHVDRGDLQLTTLSCTPEEEFSPKIIENRFPDYTQKLSFVIQEFLRDGTRNIWSDESDCKKVEELFNLENLNLQQSNSELHHVLFYAVLRSAMYVHAQSTLEIPKMTELKAERIVIMYFILYLSYKTKEIHLTYEFGHEKPKTAKKATSQKPKCQNVKGITHSVLVYDGFARNPRKHAKGYGREFSLFLEDESYWQLKWVKLKENWAESYEEIVKKKITLTYGNYVKGFDDKKWKQLCQEVVNLASRVIIGRK
jgi:hypothetical protein